MSLLKIDTGRLWLYQNRHIIILFISNSCWISAFHRNCFCFYQFILTRNIINERQPVYTIVTCHNNVTTWCLWNLQIYENCILNVVWSFDVKKVANISEDLTSCCFVNLIFPQNMRNYIFEGSEECGLAAMRTLYECTKFPFYVNIY